MSKPKESDKIWDEIRNLPIQMFSLPFQKVHQHVIRLDGGSPEVVYLKLKSSAAIVGLEGALDPKKYVFEVNNQYIMVKRFLALVEPKLTDIDKYNKKVQNARKQVAAVVEEAGSFEEALQDVLDSETISIDVDKDIEENEPRKHVVVKRLE